MKTIILLPIVSICLFLFVSEVSFSLKPFTISFPYWIKGIGACLIYIGLIMWSSGERTGGYEAGLKKGSQITIETLKELTEKKKYNE